MNSDLQNKRKLLIINRIQFGYHTDTYYYSKLLRDRFAITYLCYNHLNEKISLEDLNIIYVSKKGNYLARTIRFYRNIVREINNNHYDIIFVKYFPGASLLPLFLSKQHTLLDIRSGSVYYSKNKRIIGDKVLKFESKFYKHISVISEGLANKLGLKDAYIIPLGADVISLSEKSFKKINLLYVGTFYNRNIDTTINAVARFIKKMSTDIQYKIVGFGSRQEEDRIKNRIKDLELTGKVSFEGRVKVNDLSEYFNSSNVGVTYIPITDYYNHQPPTKLFEYALSGMINIATGTESNMKYINDVNGVICDDNENSFFEALCTVYNNLSQYNSKGIKESLSDYSWEAIVRNILIPKLLEMI